MGRRSINTTKSGKYMNPTDQARKEARKKELKKNKKQRQMVRQAVLKNKDPAQLLEEMEKIDEMEYNVLQPSPLNEKVLKEKRKKLKETFDRVMRLIHEDDPEMFSEMKRKEVEYEKRKYKRVQYFESVRHAEQVSIEDIPLPSAISDKPVPATMPKINLPPPVLLTNLPPIVPVKKPAEESTEQSQENKPKEPPGVPPFIPPNIFDMRELDSDYESEQEESDKEDKSSKDQPKDKHDKNIEEFMKEVESVQKKTEEEKVLELRIDPTPEVELENEESTEPDQQSQQSEIPPPAAAAVEIPKIPPEQPIVLPPQALPPMPLPRMPHHPMMFKPPPFRGHLPMGMGIRMPPGPPPGPRPGLRMAPGPPQRHKHHDRNQMMQPKQSTTTITAKPQIRNLSADVTRFVPSTLRSKRDEPQRAKPRSYISETQMQHAAKQNQQKTQTKDDAYAQFMNELQDLL